MQEMIEKYNGQSVFSLRPIKTYRSRLRVDHCLANILCKFSKYYVCCANSQNIMCVRQILKILCVLGKFSNILCVVQILKILCVLCKFSKYYVFCANSQNIMCVVQTLKILCVLCKFLLCVLYKETG